MIPVRKGNQPSIVSQLQVKRLQQELANAHSKLDEYEELIASLYDTLETIQSLACQKCSVHFQEFTRTAVAQGVVPQSESSTHCAQVHPLSRNLSGSSTVPDGRSQSSPSPSSNISMPSESNISLAPNNDDLQEPIYVHAPSPPSSASNYDGNRPENPMLSSQAEYDWSISFDKKVKQLVDVKLARVLEFDEVVSCLKFSPDGAYLAVGLDDGKTYVHDMKLGKKNCILSELSTTHMPPLRDRIWVMSFTSDNKYLATGNQSFIIRIWDIAKKHVRNIFKHEAGVSGVDFSLDGRFVLSAAHDGTVRRWSMRDGSCRIYSDIAVSYYSLRVTPDGRHVTAADYGGKLRIWDIRTGNQVEWNSGHNGPATISIMPDGKGIVTGGWDKTIKYWDLSFLAITQIGTVKEMNLNETVRFTAHTNVVRGVTILADGKWVISVSEDLTVRMWDSKTASRQCTMNGHEGDIWWVDASPAGNYFASGGNDCLVAIWRYDSI